MRNVGVFVSLWVAKEVSRGAVSPKIRFVEPICWKGFVLSIYNQCEPQKSMFRFLVSDRNWEISFYFWQTKLIVLEPNSENCTDLIFAAPLVRKLSLYQIQTISLLQSEHPCWICYVQVASKYIPLTLFRLGFLPPWKDWGGGGQNGPLLTWLFQVRWRWILVG